ncbi:BMP family ABC transporter substrate-binding protein [Eubacteriales bacterium KG127]
MKKILVIAFSVIMIISLTLLSGCGKKKEGGSGKDGKPVVAVVVADGFGDRSFYDSSKAGLDKLEKEGLVSPMTIECRGENFEQQMRNAADKADIIIPVGWEFGDIEKVSDDYPDKKFIWIDNAGKKNHENLLYVNYAQNEGSYLVGYIAAKMSKTGTIGAVGGQDMSTINDFIVGYEQGAKKANPDIKVVKNYVGDFEDPAQGKESAQALHSKGADVIFAVAGNSGSGVIEAGKEGGFYVVGVDSDQKYIAPDTIICSMVKNVDESIYSIVSKYVKDKKWDGNKTWIADMATGFISVAYGQKDAPQQVSDEIKKEAEAIQKEIVEGKIKVDTARQ